MQNRPPANIIANIFQLRCPRCRQGKMFETGSFSLQQPFTMNHRCPVCDQDFEPEVGFYYGAMFISYIFTGFFTLFFIMILHWVFDWSLGWSFAALIAVLAIFFVYTFRLARAIWIHIVVAYDPTVPLKEDVSS